MGSDFPVLVMVWTAVDTELDMDLSFLAPLDDTALIFAFGKLLSLKRSAGRASMEETIPIRFQVRGHRN